jgi:DNA-binding transcriptional regulator GbsR (MarR family)
VEPTFTVLRESLLDTPANAAEIYAQEQIREMHDLFELANNWFEEIQYLSPDDLTRLMKLGMHVQKVLEVKDKLTFKKTKSKEKPKMQQA